MSGDAPDVHIAGSIAADAADLRYAADLLGGIHVGYLASVEDFARLWSAGASVGANVPAAGLPHIKALGDRIAQIATYLRTAAEQYDAADRFAPLGIDDHLRGLMSTAFSMSLAAPIGLASGAWGAPRLDPRLGGVLVDGAELVSHIALGPFFHMNAVARESTSRPATTVTAEGTDGRAPRSVQDLASRVAEVGDQGGGNVAIELVTGSDGARRAIVYLRGTTRWDVGSDDPTDLDGNIVALDGRPTVYGRGVVEAMRAAGIDADTPVLLAGHSQGGMVAANLTRELAASGEFTVTDLLTFGAPFAEMDHPVAAGVQLTALQHSSDVVPMLDDRTNSKAAGTVTVTFSDGDRNAGAHDMGGYRAGAAALDASDAPAALAITARLSAFASGSTSTVQEYRVRRRR